MANNNSIFVPQTFNGARMVNVSKRAANSANPASAPSSSSSSSTTNLAPETSVLSHPTIAPAAAAPAKEQNITSKKDSKPEPQVVTASPKSKVIAIKPYASSQSVIDTRAKTTNTNRGTTSSAPKHPVAPSTSQQPLQPQPQQQQQQQQQFQQPQPQQHAAPVLVQPRPPQPVLIQPNFSGPYDIAGYDRVWSEANVAVLIQLHRKHYNGVTSNDSEKCNAAWAALTTEYNAITADNRSQSALIKKWEKLMAKYNAERTFLIMPRPQGLQQPMPSISYWNHFQYMDSYLSHVPVPENCIFKRKRSRQTDDSNNNDGGDDDANSDKPSHKSTTTPVPVSSSPLPKRPRLLEVNTEILDTQRVFMEKTLDKQNALIEMMKANAESMHEMNMKFVSICENACTKSQANEERCLNLLERCLFTSNSNNKDKPDSVLAVAAESTAESETSQPTETHSPTVVVLTKADD